MNWKKNNKTLSLNKNRLLPSHNYNKKTVNLIWLLLMNLCLKEFENEIISRMDQMLMEGGKGDGMYKVTN